MGEGEEMEMPLNRHENSVKKFNNVRGITSVDNIFVLIFKKKNALDLV